MGPDGVWPDGVARRGARRGRTGCATGGQTGVARQGRTGCPTGGQIGWPNGVPDGARRGPDGARQGGGRKDYLFLKEIMTCFVYVSCKSSSASDVSDAG
jgi:hypothetical protein